MRAIIQFNKASGAFVNAFQYVNPELLNNIYFTYAEADIDFDTQVVVGDIKTWKVVNKNEQPKVVYEISLNKLCREKIQKEYDIKLAKINEDRDIARALILEELSEKAHRICLEIRKLEQS